MLRSCIVGIGLMATLGVACERKPEDETANRTTPAAAEELTAADREFMQKAAKSNEREVELARMAQDRAQNVKVRDYAEQLEGDHSGALDDLRELARERSVTLETAPPAEKASMTDRLNAAGTRQFDRAYLELMVENHQKGIGEFERMQSTAKGELKEFIDEKLPVMREHLQKAEELLKDLGA